MPEKTIETIRSLLMGWDFFNRSKLCAMAPRIVPWVALADREPDRAGALVQLYEPYCDVVSCGLRPASVSMVGWEQIHDVGHGLSTLLHQTADGEVICNVLQLTQASKTGSGPLHAKRSITMGTEHKMRFLYHLCLEISDIICIKAQTTDEAIHMILNFRDCLESGDITPEAEFIVFIESPSSSSEPDAAKVKKQLQAFIHEGKASQWISRVVQSMTVRVFDPRVTGHSEVLATIQSSVAAAKRRRDDQGHLWTLQQLMYLVEQYFTADSPFTLHPRQPSVPAFQRPGATWYPMAFRRQSWPGADFLKHNGLTKWLRTINNGVDLNAHLAPVFARMFLEDGRMLPHQIPSSELFASIYEPLCRNAWGIAAHDRDWLSHQSLEGFLNAVISSMGLSGPDLLKEAKSGLESVGGKSLCPMCPWDMEPRIFFRCGHGLCELDSWHYSGIPIYNSDGEPNHQTMAHYKACPVCNEDADLKHRLRPLQSGYRVAVFDGGGTRGMAELVELQFLHSKLPTALSPHHYYDFVYGTSTGSIIATGVFIMRWPLSYCIDMFRSTAKQVFIKKKGMEACLKRIFRIYRSGAEHDIKSFGRILKHIHGDRLMRSTVESEEETVCVGVTATTFKGKLCVFRSYGDVLREGEDGEYTSQAFPGLRVWQAVATSCAVPPMFAPLGGFDWLDGLFTANCPAWVAMMEINKFSFLSDRQLDFCVSFGSGQFLGADRKGCWWLRRIIPEWFQRLTCCVGGAIDAGSMYRKFSHTLNNSEKDGKHYRVEPCFEGSPIAHDDPASIKGIEKKTLQYLKLPEVTEEINRLRHAMLASCFYGSLLSPPKFDPCRGEYCARLAVLSRWPEDGTICSSLYETLAKASFLVNDLRHNYNIPLYCTIYVPSLDVPLDIKLTIDGRTSHPISGFPLSINQMIYLQPPRRSLKRRGSDFGDTLTKRRCIYEEVVS